MLKHDMFHVKQLPAAKLERYAALVRQYHATLDLMSDAAIADLATKLEDARVYARALQELKLSGERVLDLGSGAGLPAIPLAILSPAGTFLLIERRKRRASFLTIVASQLELSNTTIINSDVRDVDLSPVAVITAQAVGRLALLYRLTRHLHQTRIVLLCRKGDSWRDEVRELGASLGTPAEVLGDYPLSSHGRLVAISISGGLPCPSLG